MHGELPVTVVKVLLDIRECGFKFHKSKVG
jgi:hypothetical protein